MIFPWSDWSEFVPYSHSFFYMCIEWDGKSITNNRNKFDSGYDILTQLDRHSLHLHTSTYEIMFCFLFVVYLTAIVCWMIAKCIEVKYNWNWNL